MRVQQKEERRKVERFNYKKMDGTPFRNFQTWFHIVTFFLTKFRMGLTGVEKTV